MAQGGVTVLHFLPSAAMPPWASRASATDPRREETLVFAGRSPPSSPAWPAHTARPCEVPRSPSFPLGCGATSVAPASGSAVDGIHSSVRLVHCSSARMETPLEIQRSSAIQGWCSMLSSDAQKSSWYCGGW